MRLITIIAIGALLSGCSYPYVFRAPTTDSVATFRVVDSRPLEEKRFRESPFQLPVVNPIHKLGDDQFSPDRIKALASYFAASFPNASGAVLEVTTFEVQQYFPKTIADARGGAAIAAISVPAAIIASGGSRNDGLRDWMLCYLKGSFNGVPFDVFEKEPFENRGSEPLKAVPPLLERAFSNAVAQVKRGR